MRESQGIDLAMNKARTNDWVLSSLERWVG